MTSPWWTAYVPRSWLRALRRIGRVLRRGSGRAGRRCGWRSAWSRKRRTARALSRRQRSTRSSLGPSELRRRWRLEHVAAGRRAASRSRPARSRSRELDEQLGADVAEVLHRGVQPPLGDPPAAGVAASTHPVAALAGGVAAPGDEALGDQAVDGPVGERAAERPDPADLAVGGEHGRGPSRGRRPGRRARGRRARRGRARRVRRRRSRGRAPAGRAVVGGTGTRRRLVSS